MAQVLYLSNDRAKLAVSDMRHLANLSRSLHKLLLKLCVQVKLLLRQFTLTNLHVLTQLLTTQEA